VRLAGQVPDFHAADHIPDRLVVQTDRYTHFGLAASAMALADAGLGAADLAQLNEYQLGVTTSSSSGGAEFGQREIQALWLGGPARAYLPFADEACGYVPGEGGAVLVLEHPDAYRERGGRGGYGEIAGYAATFDPAPTSGRPPNLRPAIEAALRDAHLDPADI